VTKRKSINELYKNKSDKILHILFLLCGGLTIWGITIYRMTIIDIKTLFIITLIGTAFAFIAIKKILKSSYANFWILFISVAVGGGTFYFSTLFFNQFFADKESITKEFKIVETGNLARGRRSSCSQPFAIVDFNGTEKQIVFYCDYEKTIMNFSKVLLTYKNGLFGFDIIERKELLL
jgi:hypothetical protein